METIFRRRNHLKLLFTLSYFTCVNLSNHILYDFGYAKEYSLFQLYSTTGCLLKFSAPPLICTHPETR